MILSAYYGPQNTVTRKNISQFCIGVKMHLTYYQQPHVEFRPTP